MSVKILNQKLHVISLGGKLTVRRQWLGREVEKYSSDGRHGGDAMFGEHEERQFLEPLGPWILVNTDNPVELDALVRDGYVDSTGKQWYMPDGAGFVRDDEGAVCVLTEQPMSRLEFFEKLGLEIFLDNKWENSNRVGKYLKRLWSPHKNYLQGDIIQRFGDNVILVQLPNKQRLLIRYINKLNDDLPFEMVDGMNLISEHGLRKLGNTTEGVGDGFKITGLSPHGFSKGHAIVLPNLEFDMVLYGSKPLLKGNKFTFAIDVLNPGRFYTDLQSVLNFRLYEAQFLETWVIRFYRDVLAALGDEEKLREMLRFYRVDFHKEERGEGEFIDRERDWGLLRAMRAGITVTDKPALIRKVYNLFVNRVADCQNKMRIPIPDDIGMTRYIMIDPSVFTSRGDIDVSKQVLKHDRCFCTGITGEVAFHRQPNAHRSEHWNCWSHQNDYHKKLDTGTFMFVSSDHITEIMQALGGGDQDDRVCIYNVESVVNHFGDLPTYKLEPTKPEEKKLNKSFFDMLVGYGTFGNPFSDFLRTVIYDTKQLKVMLSQNKRQRLSIGTAVNPLMMDTAISDNVEDIITYLSGLSNLTVKQQQALIAMRMFEPNKMKVIASRLEAIIDAIKKTGSDLSEEYNIVSEYWATLEVVPACLARRLPPSRKGDRHPETVKIKLDYVLENIEQIRMKLEETMTDLCWERVADIPLEISTYPTNVAGGDPNPAVALATEIKRYYRMVVSQQLADIAPDDVKGRIRAFTKDGGIDDVVYQYFKNHPLIMEGMVELYKLIYSERRAAAPRDDAGKAKPYPDGVLWGPRMSGLTMKMLDVVGLTNRYVPIEVWDRKQYRRQAMEVDVHDGVLREPGTNHLVGMVDPIVANTNHAKLVRGLLEVPAVNVINIPKTESKVFTVVAGLEKLRATPVEIAEWRSHVHELVVLAPYEYFNETGDVVHEPAVNVILKSSGKEYGHIAKEHIHNITETTEGWLTTGKSARTMQVVVRVE